MWIVNPDRLTARLIEVVGLDNSGSEPQLIGVKVGDVVELNEAPQVLERALGLH